MSVIVFDYVKALAQEDPVVLSSVSTSEGGVVGGIDLHDDVKLEMSYVIPFPQPSKTYADLMDHYALNGHSTSFLVKCEKAKWKTVTGGSLGTGDNSTTVFAFSDGVSLPKFLDLSTLKVYVDSVEQTITTHYTVSGNNTDPTITFVTAPGSGLAITVDCDFYCQVLYAEPPVAPFHKSDLTVDRVSVRFVEQKPGGRLAA